MHVAITHPYSWPEVRRGAERMIVEMSRALAARGHEVTVLTSGRDGGRSTEDAVTWVRYRRRFDDRARHERWFGLRVLPALVRGGFDAVHSLVPYDAEAAIRAARVRRHRTVYEELGNPVASAIRDRYDERARRRVIADVDVYACMSEFSRSILERDFGRVGTVLPGGVRCGAFAPAATRAAAPTVLFSGAVTAPEKGVALLLEAVAVLAERRPEVRLQLSGPGDAGPLLAAAPAAARERTEVLGLGDADGQAARYAAAWATCLPTAVDSFGLVCVESLAAGTPIVVGDGGAPPELVARGDRVGVVSALDAASLADALDAGLTLATDPATAARCRALAAHYDWDTAIAPMLESLYAPGPRR